MEIARNWRLQREFLGIPNSNFRVVLPPSLDFRKNGAKARPPDNCTLARPNRRSLGQFGGIYRTPGTLNSGVLARVGRRIPRGRTNFLHPNFLSKAKLQSSNSRGVFPPPPSWLSIFKSLHGIFSASCFLSFPLTPSWVFLLLAALAFSPAHGWSLVHAWLDSFIARPPRRARREKGAGEGSHRRDVLGSWNFTGRGRSWKFRCFGSIVSVCYFM